MKNIFFGLLLVILILPLSSASMVFEDFNLNYRLGDSISPKLTIYGDYDGFLSVNLICSSSSSYYYSPISVSSSSMINLPTLKFVEGMEGNCYLDSKIESFSKKILDSTKSSIFDLSSKLKIDLVSFPNSILPSEDIKVSLIVNSNSFNVEGKNFDFKESFDEESVSFSFPSIKDSGYFEYRFIVKDFRGNGGSFSIPIFVKSVPTSLELNLNKESFDHSAVIEVSSNVLDQSSEKMEENVTLYFLDDVFYNSFSKSLKFLPEGFYDLTAVFNNFKEIKSIEIFSSRNILFSVVGENLIVKNLGNTFFDESFDILLTSNKQFSLSERLFIPPNSSEIVSLNQVPSGYYNLSISRINEEGVVRENLENVYLSDSRNLVTKVSQGIGFLTGNSIIDLNFNSNSYFLFLIILLIIVIISFSNWKFKKSMKNIFKDVTGHHKNQTEKLTKTLNSAVTAKKRLERAFSRHVDPSVVKELINNDDLEGKKQDITVMYADIRGFTKLSQDEDVWFVVNLLNSYFERLGIIVKKHKGIIDKYIGDSLMALFNTPIKNENHELFAIKCGLEIQRAVKTFNKSLVDKGKSAISVGIGINSGEAIVGFVGSSDRMEYTAIGTTVNIASRLESKSKGILITQKLYLKLKDKIIATSVGYMEFKNIKEKIYCYNVTGLR